MDLEERIKKSKKYKIFLFVHLLSLITLFISPIIWIWYTWLLTLKVFMSSLIILFICNFVSRAINKLLNNEKLNQNNK